MSPEMEKSRYLKEAEVAEMLGVSRAKLSADRYYCRGLPYVKLGQLVRYKLTAVQAYLDEITVKPIEP